MIKSLEINERLEKYISDHSYALHPVQRDILKYNDTLGHSKKCKFQYRRHTFFNFLLKQII